MKKLALLYAGLLLLMQFSFQSSMAQGSSVLLSPPEFEEKMTQLPSSPVVDVRTPDEYTKGHIPKAVNIDWLSGQFESQIISLDTSSPVLIYCLGGGRSASAALRMKELGFHEIYELDGGMMQWRAASMTEIISGPELPGLSKSQFDKLTDTNKTAMMVFYGEWCGQCNRIKPALNEIAHELGDRLNIYWINVDDNKNLVHELGIGAIPVVQIYQGHSLIWSHTGYVEKAEVLNHLPSN